MGIFNNLVNNLNAEYKGIRVDDVCEKAGSIFGEKGRKAGKVLDNLTKNITIKIEDK